jgi:hypothetical protein
MVCPQQLGIGVSTGVELKNITPRIWLEERLASGRGGALAKDDRINIHNTFDNKSQVSTSQEWAEVEEPNAVLFARISDTQARLHADVYTRTSENPSRVLFLCTIKTGGEQGNPFKSLQCACCISPALKDIEQRFPGVLVHAIRDDTTILGDMESIFSEGGARQQLATDLANAGSELHEGKAEAYGLTPKTGLRSRRVSSSLPQSGRTQ